MSYIKEQIIHDYLLKHNNSPKQNSDQWITARQKTIGGSEISSIEGVNPYRSMKDLVVEKTNIKKWEGNIATRWGKLFEDVIQHWCEYLFDTKIHGTNVYIINSNTRTSYSPDGIGQAKYENIYTINGSAAERIVGKKITLFEFKAPLRRFLRASPPKYYVSQVKMGLNVIDICEIGVLVEIVFRRCSLGQLNFSPNEFDTTLHQPCKFFEVISCGIIYIYDDKSDSRCSTLPIDYGCCSVDDFGELLKKTADGSLRYEYSDFIVPGSNNFNVDIEPNFIGYIPWKMVNVKYHIINRDPLYLINQMAKITSVINLIDDCVRHPKEKNELIEGYFNVFEGDNDE